MHLKIYNKNDMRNSTYITILPNLQKLHQKIIIQSKVDFAMQGTSNVTIDKIMIMDFLLLVELDYMLTTFYHHILKYDPT